MKFLVFFSLLFSLSCSHKKELKKVKKPVDFSVFLKNFNQASRDLDRKDYIASIKAFKGVLAAPVPKKFKSLVWYNLGWSYESVGKYSLANKCYHKSLFSSVAIYQKLKALTFMRLAYTYKFKGNSDKELFSLLEAYKLKKYLAYFVSHIQLPVNLGAAYWTLGNKTLAKKFFLEAEKNVLTTKVKYRDPKKKIEVIAKAFYLSGKLPRWSSKYKSIQSYIKELFVLQVYLLRATALNSPVWSFKAAKELLKSYGLIFKNLKQQYKQKLISDLQYKKLKKSILYNLNKVLASSKDLRSVQNLKHFQKLKSKPLVFLIKKLKEYKALLQKK